MLALAVVSSLWLFGNVRAQFNCLDGCILSDSDVEDDGFCDCTDCSDESAYDCSSCSGGCPTSCDDLQFTFCSSFSGNATFGTGGNSSVSTGSNSTFGSGGGNSSFTFGFSFNSSYVSPGRVGNCNYLEVITFGGLAVAGTPTEVCIGDFDEDSFTTTWSMYTCIDDNTMAQYSYSDSDCTMDQTLIATYQNETTDFSLNTFIPYCGGVDTCAIVEDEYITMEDNCDNLDESNFDALSRDGYVSGFCNSVALFGISSIFSCEDDGDVYQYLFSSSIDCTGPAFVFNAQENTGGVDNCDTEGNYSSYSDIYSDGCNNTYVFNGTLATGTLFGNGTLGNFSTGGNSSFPFDNSTMSIPSDTTAAPMDGDDTTTAPVDDDDTTAAPMDGDDTTLPPVDGDDTTVAPIEDSDTTLTPIEGVDSTLAPVDDDETTEEPMDSVDDDDTTTEEPMDMDDDVTTTEMNIMGTDEPADDDDANAGGAQQIKYITSMIFVLLFTFLIQ